jgi:GPH family glycoside/pentoside/hexuronide:cation symporter
VTATKASRPLLALYSAGALGASLLLQTTLVWLLYFYAPPAGQGPSFLPPTLVGSAIAAGRLANALSNPLAAFWSDRLRSPWGRRRPFILIGSPLLCGFFMLLWMPPAAGLEATFAYLLLSLVGFFASFSLVMNPYAALLPDVAPRGATRVEAAAWQAGASLAGVGAAFLASPWLVAHYGFGGMGVSVGLAALVALSLVGIAIREPAELPLLTAPGLRESVADVVGHRPFLIYLATLTLLWLGTSMVNSTVVFVITVLMGLPRDYVGTVLGISFAGALIALPALGLLTRRWPPALVMKWTLAVSALTLPLISGIGLPSIPIAPVFEGYVLVVLAAAPLAALLVLPNALLADIAEAERTRGQAHEAMFYAIQGLILNAATAASSLLVGVLLSLGDSPENTLGLRLIPVVAGLCTALALLVFRNYPQLKRDTPSPSS